MLYILKSNRYVQLRGPIGLPEALRRFSPDDEGEPTDWSYFQDTDGSDQIKIWPPKPDAIYTMKLDYTRYLDDLEDDDDVNVLTLNYPDLLIAKIVQYGYMYLQEHQDADKWESRAGKILKDMHAQWVSKTLGQDFSLVPRADVLGHGRQIRGTGAYSIIK